jgi:hypothetical protein
MRDLIEKLLAENIYHRELSFGQEVSVNMHLTTINVLKKSPKRKHNPRGYDAAIKAHEKALKMYQDLEEGKGLVRAIRAAKKAAKEAHVLTRRLG